MFAFQLAVGILETDMYYTSPPLVLLFLATKVTKHARKMRSLNLKVITVFAASRINLKYRELQKWAHVAANNYIPREIPCNNSKHRK